MMRIVAIIAHYHVKGVVRTDTVSVIHELLKYASQVIFISTNLRDEERTKIPGTVKIIIRENIGYDFYSYKIGLDLVFDMENVDKVILMNSSFLCFKPSTFVEKVIESDISGFDAVGLTTSSERSFHVQSYLVSLNRRLLLNAEFIEWWSGMIPLNDRADVIQNYEIGLSKKILLLGCTIGAMYAPPKKLITHARRAIIRRKVTYVLSALARLRFSAVLRSRIFHYDINPTHYYWRDLFQEYGFLKLELLKSNPCNLDLTELNKDEYVKLIQEGLSN